MTGPDYDTRYSIADLPASNIEVFAGIKWHDRLTPSDPEIVFWDTLTNEPLAVLSLDEWLQISEGMTAFCAGFTARLAAAEKGGG